MRFYTRGWFRWRNCLNLVGEPFMINPGGAETQAHPSLHKVVSLIYTPTTTYSFVISKRTGMTVSQVADEVLYTGLIEMQELDGPG